MTVPSFQFDLDPFLARQDVDRGEHFLMRAAASVDFCSELTCQGISEIDAVDAMLLASDPNAREFAEFGRARARVLSALPLEFRAAFLRTHDVRGMTVLDLFLAVQVFARLAPGITNVKDGVSKRAAVGGIR